MAIVVVVVVVVPVVVDEIAVVVVLAEVQDKVEVVDCVLLLVAVDTDVVLTVDVDADVAELVLDALEVVDGALLLVAVDTDVVLAVDVAVAVLALGEELVDVLAELLEEPDVVDGVPLLWRSALVWCSQSALMPMSPCLCSMHWKLWTACCCSWRSTPTWCFGVDVQMPVNVNER